MPARSKSQQRIMGMAHALQKGELRGKAASSPKVRKIAGSMTKKQTHDFAATPRKGLPNRVSKEGYMDEDAMGVISQFNTFGEALKRSQTMRELAEKLGQVAEMAQGTVVNEADDWFDAHTVSRNMKEMQRYSGDFSKLAEEADTLHERMTALYDDMGHVLNRYFDINEVETMAAGDSDEVDPEDVEGPMPRPSGEKFDSEDDDPERPQTLRHEAEDDDEDMVGLTSMPSSRNDDDEDDDYRHFEATSPRGNAMGKPFACQECGKQMSLKDAERAARNGCPKCGGVDIDVSEGLGEDITEAASDEDDTLDDGPWEPETVSDDEFERRRKAAGYGPWKEAYKWGDDEDEEEELSRQEREREKERTLAMKSARQARGKDINELDDDFYQGQCSKCGKNTDLPVCTSCMAKGVGNAVKKVSSKVGSFLNKKKKTEGQDDTVDAMVKSGNQQPKLKSPYGPNTCPVHGSTLHHSSDGDWCERCMSEGKGGDQFPEGGPDEGRDWTDIALMRQRDAERGINRSDDEPYYDDEDESVNEDDYNDSDINYSSDDQYNRYANDSMVKEYSVNVGGRSFNIYRQSGNPKTVVQHVTPDEHRKPFVFTDGSKAAEFLRRVKDRSSEGYASNESVTKRNGK